MAIFFQLLGSTENTTTTIKTNETTIGYNTTFNKNDGNNTSNDTNMETTTTLVIQATTTEDDKLLDYSSDFPSEKKSPCYFLQDIVNASLKILSKRCQRVIYGKVLKWNICYHAMYQQIAW